MAHCPSLPTQENPSKWLLDCFVKNWSKFWSLYLKAPPLAEFDFELEGPYKSGRSQNNNNNFNNKFSGS
jgi:hypothetical protein